MGIEIPSTITSRLLGAGVAGGGTAGAAAVAGHVGGKPAGGRPLPRPPGEQSPAAIPAEEPRPDEAPRNRGDG